MAHSQSALPSLNEKTTQDAIVSRLPQDLRYDWIKYQYRYLSAEDAVPFNEFSKWIEDQANILRRESFLKPNTSGLGKVSQKPNQEVYTAPSSNHAQGPSGGNNAGYNWRNQKSSGTVPAEVASHTEKTQGVFVCVFCEEEGRYKIAHDTVPKE